VAGTPSPLGAQARAFFSRSVEHGWATSPPPGQQGLPDDRGHILDRGNANRRHPQQRIRVPRSAAQWKFRINMRRQNLQVDRARRYGRSAKTTLWLRPDFAALAVIG
jgi:hypothetical protein